LSGWRGDAAKTSIIWIGIVPRAGSVNSTGILITALGGRCVGTIVRGCAAFSRSTKESAVDRTARNLTCSPGSPDSGACYLSGAAPASGRWSVEIHPNVIPQLVFPSKGLTNGRNAYATREIVGSSEHVRPQPQPDCRAVHRVRSGRNSCGGVIEIEIRITLPHAQLVHRPVGSVIDIEVLKIQDLTIGL